jgi:hypothetical protein
MLITHSTVVVASSSDIYNIIVSLKYTLRTSVLYLLGLTNSLLD